jgi:hypothetical protein
VSGSYWCQSTDTTTTYTVTARREQAERWEAAASADGLRGVGSWLAETADTHLRERAQTGRAAPLTWLRDRFRVLVTGTTARPEVAHEIEVRGMVSGPFGIFRGDGRGLGEPGCSLFSLVHRPTRRVVATLPLRKSCMALAAELSGLEIDWQEIDPERVLGAAPDRGKAQALIRLFEKLTRT